MKQALVVGGSGMLEGTSLWLTERFPSVSVIGRDKDKLNRLATMNTKINPVSVDYKDNEAFSRELDRLLSFGEIEIVVAWIHSDAPDALRILIDKINVSQCGWKLFHVLGSSSDLDKLAEIHNRPGDCSYRQVKLGFVLEPHGSRWLTNEEISNGVIRAIELDQERFIAGTVAPWNKRPSW